MGDQWSDEGWLVPVEFDVAERPVKPKDVIDELAPHLADKYAPLQPNGNGNQGVYLTEVSIDLARVLLNKMGLSITLFAKAKPVEATSELTDDHAQEAIEGRTDIGETQKQQLVLARRGQGVFKANVRLNETQCRITGVADPHFLIASHIKPWRDCADHEKLDGSNGLLLSPHVDQLFDLGLISFADDGTVLKSAKLPPEVWSAWGLDPIVNVGAFKKEQTSYLIFHRYAIFQR